MEEEFRDNDEKRRWSAVYQEIIRSSEKYSSEDAKKTENSVYNRYRDVSPYDHSRIRLNRSETDYINACLVKVAEANRAYILTQGPLNKTAGHFWLMIWEQNSKAILMLNRVVEKNVSKCYQYWPKCSERNSNKLVFNDVGLDVTFLGQTESSFIITKLLLTDIKSQESRVVLHFHYTTWPDFGVPESPSAFLNFLRAVKEHHVLDKNVGPTVIHCSAGIGRSGTFCLVDSCLVLCEKSNGSLEKGKIKQVLLDMRTYRMGLIQTPDQLRFSYLAILEGAKRFIKLRNVDNENNHMTENGHDIFCASEGTSNELEPIQVPPKNDMIIPDCNLTYADNSSPVGNKECIEPNCSDSNTVNSSVLPQGTNSTLSKSSKSPTIITSSNSSETQSSCVPNISTSENRLSIDSDSLSSNISSVDTESNRTLRKRQRQEKIEKTSKKVNEMKEKQVNSEKWLKRRRLIFNYKTVSICVVMLFGVCMVWYRNM
ncbi:Tyrosine-protein phosphatase non-receptor type 2 [Nymphon striatum]|nr:Tyrosine-protein phosphatase non-receptor type 2 [Nymphon striatum]